jgi:PAS domain S-box-containing protein
MSNVETFNPETKAKVLLVDDRPDKLLALSAILEDMGQDVVTARSGQEALRCLLKDDFAVILLDVNMPQMDGFETAALIRERARSEKTPIIFLTAYSEAEVHAARGYSLGAVDYIQMPVQPEVLKAKVSVFVDLFRKSERIRQQAAEVTDRLHFETRRNRFFTLAVDMLGIAAFDGYFRQLNPAWERALGWTDAELRERPFAEFLHPDDRAAADSAFRRLAEDLFTARFEARHRHKAGGYRWLSWSAAAFKEEGLVYVFAHDVTDRKAAEEDRLQLVREQEARRTAQRENEIKDQFLATLSHELRAPLTPILSWTSLLRSGLVDPESVARGIEVIDRNVRLQVRLVEDLLDTSRIISGKLHVERRGMDLLAVIEAGLEAVGSRDPAEAAAAGGPPARHAGVDPGRSAAAAAGDLEPGLERRQVHAGGRSRRGAARTQRGDRAALRERHRHRHQPGLPAARVRSLPPGRDRQRAQVRRAGARPDDRAPRRRGARRKRGSVQRRRRRRLVLLRHVADAVERLRRRPQSEPGGAGARARPLQGRQNPERGGPMKPRNEDDARVEERTSLRIKLFKESSRQDSPAAPEQGRSAREEWDRRQSIRSRFDSTRDSGAGLRS